METGLFTLKLEICPKYIPDTITVGEYQVRVFRPKAVTTCKCCQKEGHPASDDVCEALAPQDIQDSAEVFQGGKFPLSNLKQVP